MDISQIRKLIRLIQNTDVNEVEVSEGDHTVRISRSTGMPAAPPPQAAPVAQPSPAAPASPPAEAAPAIEESEHVVNSPMVGTFYRSPSPEAEEFVTEGTKVKRGEILCIIEAMKLMNEIEAEYDGVVEKILVENATPIEYGQAMFIITPLA